jgi:hypothetical protein
MHRHVLLLLSRASAASFLEDDGDRSDTRRSKQTAVSRDRGMAKSGETRFVAGTKSRPAVEGAA